MAEVAASAGGKDKAMPSGKNPSLKFQNGEVQDFYQAMEVLVQQQVYESMQTKEILQGEDGAYAAKLREEADGAIEEVKRVADLAKSIYYKTVELAIRRAAKDMRAHNDAQLSVIADALESGDYSGLAM